MQLEDTRLFQHVADLDTEYAGKLQTIASNVERWLEYVPSSFPSYTRHTLGHSRTIIARLSSMLFDDSGRPTIELSAVEAYVLGCAALLHDAGMVVTDSERNQLLRSDSWTDWTEAEPSRKARLDSINDLSNASDPPDEALRVFLAGRELRFLVGEYFRQRHAERARAFLRTHDRALGLATFDDAILGRTIEAVCAGHGLAQRQLEDDDAYPTRRDIRDEKANVRLLAVLLRIGDLLDMQSDRACPLALSAASPLPVESVAHWSKYRGIRHFLVAPDVIELTVECETQEEHRAFLDWCEWLVDELRFAAVVASRSMRHPDWRPPRATLGERDTTIQIRAAPNADYRFREWRLELDHDVIFDRLIRDVHREPRSYVRELLQNALDAVRCQVAIDQASNGQSSVAFPNTLPVEIRERYPIRISLAEVEVHNDLSGTNEHRQLLSIDDPGIGMDQEVIERYFLQVGRSYYQSAEFKRRFEFVPSGRFGLGFLSVFSDSSWVQVETMRTANPDAESIRLTLTGPRQYLLTQIGHRSTSGTRIDVRLDSLMLPGELTQLLQKTCQMVEFPIVLDDLGQKSELGLVARDVESVEVRDLSNESATFRIRSFPTETLGIFGELFVFERETPDGVSWTSRGWARNTYLAQHPGAVIPDLPRVLLALHGITTSETDSYGAVSARLDFRQPGGLPTLGREELRGWYLGPRDVFVPELRSRWASILEAHMAKTKRGKGPNSWRYKQALAHEFPLPEVWRQVPGTIPAWVRGSERQTSLMELEGATELGSLVVYGYLQSPTREELGRAARRASRGHDTQVLLGADIASFDEFFVNTLFGSRRPASAASIDESGLLVRWLPEAATHSRRYSARVDVIELPWDNVVGLELHPSGEGSYEHILLNSSHPVVAFLEAAQRERLVRDSGAAVRLRTRILEAVANPYGDKREALSAFLHAWASETGSELTVPDVAFEAGAYLGPSILVGKFGTRTSD